MANEIRIRCAPNKGYIDENGHSSFRRGFLFVCFYLGKRTQKNALIMCIFLFCLKDRKVEETDNGWDQSIKDCKPLQAIELRNWCLFFVQRDQQAANAFIDGIFRLRNIQISEPKK